MIQHKTSHSIDTVTKLVLLCIYSSTAQVEQKKMLQKRKERDETEGARIVINIA